MSESTAIVRQEFDGKELAPIVETSATAVAERAKAQVQARAIMAIQRPRDIDVVRTRLLRECERPGFADVARYKLPRGGKSIEGPTIRFAEAVVRTMGNLDVSTDVIYDDAGKRIVRVSVVDLETNAAYAQDVAIDKVVERRQVRAGQEVIGTRTNSTGQQVYLVAADEGELLVKQGALVSKALRNAALRLLPGDILEECMGRVLATQANRDAKDPDAARKKLVDAFYGIGVMADALKQYLGCDLTAASPTQLDELRAIYAGISTGEATWAEVMAERAKAATGEAPSTGGKVDALKEKMRRKKAAKEPAHDPVTGETEPAEPGADG